MLAAVAALAAAEDRRARDRRVAHQHRVGEARGRNTWTISTSLLRQAAVATLVYGIVVLFAAWLSGPTRLAIGSRRTLAPYLREPAIAYGGLTLIVIVLLAGARRPRPVRRSPR